MKRILVTVALLLVLCLVLPAFGCDSESQPETAADFYKGKTINVIVNSSAGGSTDCTARVLGSYLERDTGASVVFTTRKGAGGLEGVNYVYTSEPDGLTLGAVSGLKFMLNKIMDEPAAVYELEEFSYLTEIGARLSHFMVAPDGPYQSVADLQAGEDMILGGGSPAGTVCLGSMSVIELLDLDAQVVTGIDEEADRALAVKRGEIVGYTAQIANTQTNIDSGLIEPMFVLGTERDPLMPDVPAITEIISIAGEDLELVELWEDVLVSSSLFVAPPGVPEDRLAFLHGLIAEWIQDEAFRAEIDLISGCEEESYNVGDAVAEKMLNLADDLEYFKDLFLEMIEKYRL